MNIHPAFITSLHSLIHQRSSSSSYWVLFQTITGITFHHWNCPDVQSPSLHIQVYYTLNTSIMTQQVKWIKVYSFDNTSQFLQETVTYPTANCKDGPYHTVKECLKEVTTLDEIPTEVSDPSSEERPTQKEIKKQANRVVAVTAHDIFMFVGEDMNSQLNSASQQRTLYTKFSEKLVTDGIIKWRHHTSKIYVCLLSDYNPTTGHLLLQSFVHIYATTCQNAPPIFRCTCQIYNLIERATN